MKSGPVVLLCLSLAGCRSPSEAPSAEGCFEDIGTRSLTQEVSPESYLLVRCDYAAAGEVRSLTADVPLAAAPPAARADLAKIIAELEAKLRESGSEGPEAASAAGEGEQTALARAYGLAVGERWIADLDLADPGGAPSVARVRGRVNQKEIRFTAQAPALVSHLRGLSFGVLRQAMARPRRALDWQYAAVAAFLGERPAEAGAETDAELRREVLDHLAAASEPSSMAEGLISRAEVFEEAELSRFLESDKIHLRVLALTRAALGGNRDALKEIAVLSLEYLGRERLFDTALRRLFPRAVNRDLYSRHPPPADGLPRPGFAREVHSRLPDARHRPPEGWELENPEARD
jgi:hypothetical protein